MTTKKTAKTASKSSSKNVSVAMSEAFTQTLIEHDLLPPVPNFAYPESIVDHQPTNPTPIQPLFEPAQSPSPSLFEGENWTFSGPAGADIQGALFFTHTGVNAKLNLSETRHETVQVTPTQVSVRSTGADGVTIDYFSSGQAPGSLVVEQPSGSNDQFQFGDSGQIYYQRQSETGITSGVTSTDLPPTRETETEAVWESEAGATITKPDSSETEWSAQIETPQGVHVQIDQRTDTYTTRAFAPNGSVTLESDSSEGSKTAFLNSEAGTYVWAEQNDQSTSTGFVTREGWAESTWNEDSERLNRVHQNGQFWHQSVSEMATFTATGSPTRFQAEYQFADGSQYQESFRNDGSFGVHWTSPDRDQFALNVDSNAITEHFESTNGISESLSLEANQSVNLEYQNESGTLVANSWTNEDGVSISVANTNGVQLSVNANLTATSFSTSDAEGTLFKYEQINEFSPEISYHSETSSSQFKIAFQSDGQPQILAPSSVGDFQPVSADTTPFQINEASDLSQSPVLQQAFNAAAPTERVAHHIQLENSNTVQTVAQPGRFQATAFFTDDVQFEHYSDFDQNAKFENWVSGSIRGGSYFVEGSYQGQYFQTEDGPTFIKEVAPDGNQLTVYNSPDAGFSHVITEPTGSQFTHTIDANDVHSYVAQTPLGLQSLQIQPDGGLHFSGPVANGALSLQHHIQPDLESTISVQGSAAGEVRNWLDGADGYSYGDFQTANGLLVYVQNSQTGIFGRVEAPSGYQATWLTQPNGSLLFSSASEDRTISQIEFSPTTGGTWTCYQNSSIQAQQRWLAGEAVPNLTLPSGESIGLIQSDETNNGFEIRTEYGSVDFLADENGKIQFRFELDTLRYSAAWNCVTQELSSQAIRLGAIEINHDYSLNDRFFATYSFGGAPIQIHGQSAGLICRGYDRIIKTDFPIPAPQGIQEFPHGLAESSGLKDILAEVVPPLTSA